MSQRRPDGMYAGNGLPGRNGRKYSNARVFSLIVDLTVRVIRGEYLQGRIVQFYLQEHDR